jgi:hypothetical protein
MDIRVSGSGVFAASSRMLGGKRIRNLFSFSSVKKSLERFEFAKYDQKLVSNIALAISSPFLKSIGANRSSTDQYLKVGGVEMVVGLVK